MRSGSEGSSSRLKPSPRVSPLKKGTLASCSSRSVIGAPVAGAVTLLPAFPYNQLSVSVNGTAYYEDLGKFLADFENRFPCMRIQNLNLEPGYGPNADDREKLTFHMDIISLTRANPQ